ncbi:MAG: PD-(D/E)XK nuclease family protein [Clostridia bacterium]|nr:PD-(D/E)XK nuclease family protein [Clostridia bacterium]
MFEIFATNTYKDGSRYIYEKLKKVDPKQLRYKHIVIVPDRVSMTAENQMLNALGGSFNIRVLTLRRFGAELLPRFNYLTKQSALMTLSSLVDENKDNFVCYKKGYDSDGFIENLYETICQFKYARALPDNINCDILPPNIRPKIQDIKLLYKAYEDFLQTKKYVDSAGKMEELIKIIPTDSKIKNTYFYIYDFDNFSGQEQAVITELVKNALGVTAVCCHSEKPKHKYLYVNDLLPLLTEIANKSGKQHALKTAYNLSQDAFIKQIQEYLYTYEKPHPVKLSSEKLIIAQAENLNNEVENLARYITDGVRKGNRYGDYFVVASDAESYRQSVERIFAEYDIPFFADTQTGLINHPYSRFVIDYLSMRKNNNKLENVLSFIKNPFFFQGEEIFYFENYCLKYNVGYDFTQFELGKNESGFTAAEKIRQKLYEAINYVEFDKAVTVKGFVEAVKEFLQKSQAEILLAEFTERQKNLLPRYAKVSEQAASKFNDILQTLSDTLGEKPCDIDGFLKILSTGLAGVKVSVLPLYNDCVVLTNMAKSKKHDIKRLCLLGANQSAMPIVKKDSKLLSDKNMDLLQKSGIALEQKMRLENKREKFNVFQLLNEPTESLYVSYCETAVIDNSATAISPSDFVLQLKRLFTLDGVNEYPTLKNVYENVFTKKSALSQTVMNMRNIIDKRPIKDVYFEIKQNLLDSDIKKVFAANREIKDINNGKELFFSKDAVSISKIEDFYSCPYKHFLRYGLDLTPREKSELNPNDFGSILHAVLEKYIAVSKDESYDETKRKAEMFFEQVIADDYYQGIAKDPKNKHALKLLKTEAVKMCRLVNEQLKLSHFVNFKAEMRFGFCDSQFNAIEIPAGGETVKLHGIIDRIDVMNEKNNCLVIDYKSGNAEYNEKLLYAGRKLQLLVYTKAVMENFGFKPVGFYYFKLHDKFVAPNSKERAYSYVGRTVKDSEILKDIDTTLLTQNKSARLGVSLNKDGLPSNRGSNLLTQEQFDAQIEYAIYCISQAGELMQKGFIKASPYEKVCTYCDYANICGANDIFDAAERKAENVDADTIVKVIKE